MAVKTTLTVAGPNFVLTGSSHIWVVGTAAEAHMLAENNITAVAVALDNGNPISEWTSRHGIGDWTPANTLFSVASKRVFIAFDPAIAVQTKTENFVKEFKKTIAALGGVAEEQTIPAGKTLAEFAKGCGSQDNLLERLNKATEVVDAKKVTTVTNLETDADLLFEIANAKFDFYRSDKGEPFVVLKNGPKYVWPVLEGTPNLGDYLAEEFLTVNRKVVPSYAIKDALNAIKARCGRRGTPSFPVSLRSAQSESTENYWIDLGREDGKVVKLTQDGWTVEDQPDADVFFKRTASIYELPLPVAASPGSEKEVLKSLLGAYVNVDETDWSLLVSWMVAHLIPTYIPPIAILLSSADAGKSTATMAVRFAVEGKMVKGKNMNTDERDMSVTMASERVTIFNNVSHVSKRQSDFLCDVIDRTEYEARTLRTNSGVTVLDIDSSILMNGITTGELKGDFKTRAVVLELKPITGGRKSDEEIKRGLRKAHPQILGALMGMAARVLSRAPHQTLDHTLNLRLVDYVRTVMAVDELWELQGQGIRRYVHALKSMASTAVDDLMFKVVHELAVTDTNWNGKGYELTIIAEDLRKHLNEAKTNEYARSLGNNKRGTWETGAAVTASIRKVEPDWKRMGVTYESLGQQRLDGKKGTLLKFVFTPEEDTQWPLHYEKSTTSVISILRPVS
jgi:hypothetical protein